MRNVLVCAHTGAPPASPPHIRKLYGVSTASLNTVATNGPLTFAGQSLRGVSTLRAGWAVGQYSKKL